MITVPAQIPLWESEHHSTEYSRTVEYLGTVGEERHSTQVLATVGEIETLYRVRTQYNGTVPVPY